MFTRATAPVRGLDVPINVLVTGASSGIGLGLLTQLLDNRHVARAIAVSRRASSSEAIDALGDRHGNRLQRIDCDLTDEASLARLDTAIGARGQPLHLVINAAGLLHEAGLQPEKTLEQVSAAALAAVFAVNAHAPILLARTLLPRLVHGRRAVFASISARVGSTGDNRTGGWYAYRASKAAQNQLMKTLAIELARRSPQVTVLTLHPGTVNTPLSAPFQARVPAGHLFSVQRAAAQLLAIIAGATPADSGRFIAWDGTDVPW